MQVSSTSRQGLRVTVRLYDTIIEQEVHWQPTHGASSRFTLSDVVPTPSGRPLASGQWLRDGRLRVEAEEPTACSAALGLGDTWSWSNGEGVEVDLDLVGLKHAQRTSKEAWGDVALLVLMLTLMAGVGQVNYLLRQLSGSLPAHEQAFEPTPELIARLLKRDFDGADRGRPMQAIRPEAPQANPSFYLPAGHEGDWNNTAGGSNTGAEVRRGARADDAIADSQEPRDLKPGVDDVDLLPLPQNQDPEAPQLAAELDVEVVLEEAVDEIALAEPIERFIGWGFRDWFEVADSRGTQEEQIARVLEGARVRLKINPDDPYAIQTAAYYAYLSENHDLGAALHQRFIELYPSEPSGYNNLALTHKRKGEYTEEEALYRKALALDPIDHHVINNLAVNLAHQGRFDEALRLMASLEELTPGDPYADLHRAKIYAAMGKKGLSLKLLKRALAGVEDLDTLHHIEFRQDIRLDPAFEGLRDRPRFQKILRNE